MQKTTPWLEFEKKTWPQLSQDCECDVAIIGSGISGVMTLYHLLTSTEKNVILFEKNRVANGATGHNAGLAIAAMEKPTAELIEQFGLERTGEIFRELDQAWDDLLKLHELIGLNDNLVPFSHFANGFNSLPEFLTFLQGLQIRNQFSGFKWRYLVCENLETDIPVTLRKFIEFVPHQMVLEALKTADSSYIGAALSISPMKAMRMNSAKFCHKVLEFLEEKFSPRFCVYEQTNILKVRLGKNQAVLESPQGKTACQTVILCTNAYKDFSIWDETSQKPVTKFHDAITPRIGFLAAFANSSPKGYALGFGNDLECYKDVPFWYFSHAPHPDHNPDHACVIGGPEFDWDGVPSLPRLEEQEKLSTTLIQHFLKSTFDAEPNPLPYFWHGWMGYTADRMRWVGPDSDHQCLWYNLACNGVGIVQAVASGKKIAQLFSK